QAWQDSVHNTSFTGTWASINQVKRAGYATHITKGNNNGVNGYDNSPWQPSIRALVPNSNAALLFGTATNNNVASTDNTTTDGQFNSRPGYMLFVRGDRNIYLPSAVGAGNSVTTLRPIGTLRTGNRTVTGNSTSFTVVGNPYASAVDFVNVISHSTLVTKDY